VKEATSPAFIVITHSSKTSVTCPFTTAWFRMERYVASGLFALNGVFLIISSLSNVTNCLPGYQFKVDM